VTKIKRAAEEFLAHRRVAVTGVSREPKDHGSNIVYRRLRERGYDVFAVNPNADEVEGDRCYPDLGAIPGGVEAVVIATRPEAAEHGRERGIAVIDGGCPCMFGRTADRGHKVMRAFLTLSGNVPRQV
jgi:hypothetical protein